MPIEITMPKLSDTMTEGTLVKWLKKEREAVKPGDIIAEVETDKATQELEVFEAGTIAKVVVPEGGKTPVGGVIVVIAKPGENVDEVAAGVKGGATPPAAPAPSPGPAVPHIAVSAGGAPMVAKEGEEAEEVPVEDHEEGTERAVPGGKMRVSPLARKIAEEKGVDLRTIRGTGPDGRIVKRDVLEAAARPQRAAAPAPAAPAYRPGAPVAAAGPSTAAAPPLGAAPAKLEQKTVPLTSMRQTIARRLQQSKQTIPHFYASIDVQVGKLLELREAANTQLAPEKLSVTDFVARAVAVALTRVPQINATFTETAILQHGNVDLGIAVALEEGLVVPVLRGAQNKSVRQISQEIRSLAEQARARRLKAQDMTGATFTITNLGMYGVKDFLAIINPPESAILAVGAGEWRPVVNAEKQIVAAQVMTLSLSADHRVVDGAVGARFLAEMKGILENPLTMLM